MLPPHLHLIWLGGVPPNTEELPYRYRLMEWRKHNPTWSISLWNDSQAREREQLLLWCNEHGITLQAVQEMVNWGGEKKFFDEECAERFYVTASDMLRLRVLYQCGGFYVDFDVMPLALPMGALPLGIAMLLQNWDGRLASISPHAIASYAGHPLLQMALWEAEFNFQLLEKYPDQDYRKHEDPSYRYGSALALTGDLLRPALALCGGVLPQQGYPWTPWFDVMQMAIKVQHLEDNSWLAGERPSERIYPQKFMAAKAARLAWQRQRSVTSILHIAAAFGSAELIEYASSYIPPFEDYFGHTPRGIAQRYQRGPKIMKLIPDL